MKKTYMTPEIQTVELAVKQMIMIAASGAAASGLEGASKQEWDPSDPVDW